MEHSEISRARRRPLSTVASLKPLGAQKSSIVLREARCSHRSSVESGVSWLACVSTDEHNGAQGTLVEPSRLRGAAWYFWIFYFFSMCRKTIKFLWKFICFLNKHSIFPSQTREGLANQDEARRSFRSLTEFDVALSAGRSHWISTELSRSWWRRRRLPEISRTQRRPKNR